VAIPESFTPGVASARRWYWLLERRRAREGYPAAAGVFRGRRLAQPGTGLWPNLPGRAALAAYGVLAVEEVRGADPDELRAYGLDRRTAEALIAFLERREPMTTFQSGPRAGELYEQDAVTLLASAARTTSTTSDTYELGDRGTLRLLLDVTAFTGTSLHVQVETRVAAASGTWRVVDAFAIVGAVGSEYRAMGGVDRFVRVVATFSGTTATYSVAGTAV
jgi:hypothetical protein